MSKMDLGPIGAVLSPGDPGFVDTAVQLEQLGFPTLWLTGGPMASLDQVADVVRATESVRVATGIIAVDRFGADEVTALFEELGSDHPGRFIVGLGGAHGSNPIDTLSAYLDRLGVPATSTVLAALGPRMLRLARDRTAGAYPVLVTPGYTAQARATLGDDRILAVNQLVVLDTDAAIARHVARGPLDFLGRLPAYRSNFRRMGFTDADIDTLGDGLVDALVAWGDVGAIAARVRAHEEAGADHAR